MSHMVGYAVPAFKHIGILYQLSNHVVSSGHHFAIH